jgi:hypothetical protein
MRPITQWLWHADVSTPQPGLLGQDLAQALWRHKVSRYLHSTAPRIMTLVVQSWTISWFLEISLI